MARGGRVLLHGALSQITSFTQSDCGCIYQLLAIDYNVTSKGVFRTLFYTVSHKTHNNLHTTHIKIGKSPGHPQQTTDNLWRILHESKLKVYGKWRVNKKSDSSLPHPICRDMVLVGHGKSD